MRSRQGSARRLLIAPGLVRHARIDLNRLDQYLTEQILGGVADRFQFGRIARPGGDADGRRAHAISRRSVEVASNTITTAKPIRTAVSVQSELIWSPRIMTPRSASLA